MQDTSEPQPSAGETQKDMNNVSCRRDMTEILLKTAYNTIQFIFVHEMFCSNNLDKQKVETIVAERENAGNQHFLFFPQRVLP